jgi:ribosomal peptide maturation radical SAM protein 1
MLNILQESYRAPAPRPNSSRSSFRVALVSMPFASAKRPSIQLGLLKSILVSHGFPTTTFHLNLDFAVQIGATLYEELCSHRGPQIGDWLFSRAAFGDDAPDVDGRLIRDFDDTISRLLRDLGKTSEVLLQLRDEDAPRYLDHLMKSVLWADFRVVGFTSTFQQNVASFALAARIKRQFPHIQTVFGGANFEGEMGQELARGIDCIDYAIAGEGDHAFPELLTALHEGSEVATTPSVLSRNQGAATSIPRPLLKELDQLPVPDYEEFFERAKQLGLHRHTAAEEIVYIPFESARGCWWGQKHHCTFCGLNGEGMSFRAKSPKRILDELAELARRHGSFYFEAVDNILDLSYLTAIFSELAKSGIDYRLFYEVKANLTRQQLKVLVDGGVHRIQPGIESLSTHVLKLMRKGITAIQNVNLLRWALYYRIRVSWNLIWGFPQETEDDYKKQLELLRRITHLPPPVSAGRIWMERFSPLFFDRAEFPAGSVKPERSYAYVYPRGLRLDRVAYFFDYELDGTLPDSSYAETLQHVKRWRSAWTKEPRPRLVFWHAPGLLKIHDSRDPHASAAHSFSGPAASLYAACSDRPRGVSDLRQSLGLPLSEEEIYETLHRFSAAGLMMQEGTQFLSLALPATHGR